MLFKLYDLCDSEQGEEENSEGRRDGGGPDIQLVVQNS